MIPYACPSCDNSLPHGATHCVECGWSIRTSREDAARMRRDAKRSDVKNDLSQSELEALESTRHTVQHDAQTVLLEHRDEIDAVPKHRRWAKRILILHDAGLPVELIALELAREVMGVEP